MRQGIVQIICQTNILSEDLSPGWKTNPVVSEQASEVVAGFWFESQPQKVDVVIEADILGSQTASLTFSPHRVIIRPPFKVQMWTCPTNTSLVFVQPSIMSLWIPFCMRYRRAWGQDRECLFFEIDSRATLLPVPYLQVRYVLFD